MQKILFMGLPGSGKTTLAKSVCEHLRKYFAVVHFNADEVRENINKDLGFSEIDRIENARRFGWLANKVVSGGAVCICDFICPTKDTRKAFDPDIIVFLNTISSGRFENTNKIFVPPSFDESKKFIKIDRFLDEESINHLLAKILNDLLSSSA